MKICWRFLLLISLFFSFGKVQASIAFTQMPRDLDQVDIYLHTVDIGNMIYSNFGHTALRVHDKTSGRDLVFSWGTFSFQNGPIVFGLNFYRGILIYQMSIWPYAHTLKQYQWEERKVWEDKFEFTREQKQKLLEKLIWNSKPENVSYAYQYFFDNCSTRIRDYVDEALDGAIKKTTHLNHAPQTFRDMVYDGYSYTPGMDLFLDIAMNGNLDRLMTIWERMFHPHFMREVYQQHQNMGHSLLSNGHVILEFPRPESYPGLSFLMVLLIFGIPLSVLCIAFFLRDRLGKALPWIYRMFGLISLPLTGFGALLGFLMPVTWAVSAHTDLHHNANMLLFWPLDILLLFWVFAIVVQGHGWALSEKWITRLRFYILLHMVGTLLMPVLRILGFIHQNVDRILVWVLPPYMVILFLLWRVGTQIRKSQKA